jgi:hypothetical protein
MPLLDKVLQVACHQAECWVSDGIQKAMNRFNGAVDGPANEGKEQ